MKKRIIEMLEKADGYVSGEEISEKLGITRSGVWKHINSLKSEGYEITSVRNRGYKLNASPDLLSEEKIRQRMHGSLLGSRITVMKTVDSTNEEVKRRAHEGAESGLIVASESQTAGKGRFSRKWSSGSDGGLYFSFLLRPELPPSDMAGITLACGHAVCQAIREYTGLPAQIKWPNDIIIGRKKVCGILTEMAAQSDQVDYVVTGIGINVNNPSFPEEIADKADSLYLETGEKLDRNEFFACVINHLDRVIQNYLVSLSIEDIEQFKSLCATIGKEVSVQRGNIQYKGKAFDVAPTGELMILTEDGRELSVNSGEVTVQGIY